MSMATSNIFEDLVILIQAYPDVEKQHRDALLEKLKQNGAAVRSRWGKELTHIVVQRTAATPADAAAQGDAVLRGLFGKNDQVRWWRASSSN
jgi:hypothetical protein